MKSSNLRVLVVDDDFMIANLHGKYIDKQEGYELAGIANNYIQTLARVRELEPDLVLLDVYLPDRSGIEALRTMRAEKIPCDIILITAAREISIIEEAFRLGIFDYLIKPFDLDILNDTLEKYRQFKIHLKSPVQADQQFVERLKKFRAAKPLKIQDIPKGIDSRTLEKIKQCLMQNKEHRSSEEIANAAGVSRSTARAYLDYLVEQGVADEFLQYGTVGRPQRLFGIRKSRNPRQR
jgi:response regulator of citrate/malate metabolism